MNDIVRVQSQSQCETGYRFDKDSCTCHSINRCHQRCPSGYLRSPLIECGCINYETFQELYTHDLDENCMEKEISVKANVVLMKNSQIGS